MSRTKRDVIEEILSEMAFRATCSVAIEES